MFLKPKKGNTSRLNSKYDLRGVSADTTGTKPSLAYIYWKETGDNSVWRGIVQDAIVMNIDDLLCAGATNNIIISSTIGRNKYLIPGEAIEHLIKGTADY